MSKTWENPRVREDSEKSEETNSPDLCVAAVMAMMGTSLLVGAKGMGARARFRGTERSTIVRP